MNKSNKRINVLELAADLVKLPLAFVYIEISELARRTKEIGIAEAVKGPNPMDREYRDKTDEVKTKFKLR